jgi:hypothetical protein
MADELHRVPGLPGIAASAMSINAAVGLDTTGDVQRQYLPLASCNLEPVGLAVASVVNPGDALTVYDQGHVVRWTAIASIGHGADVGVASTNGALGLIAGASGSIKFRVGRTLTAGVAGDTVSLLVHPRQTSGFAA